MAALLASTRRSQDSTTIESVPRICIYPTGSFVGPFSWRNTLEVFPHERENLALGPTKDGTTAGLGGLAFNYSVAAQFPILKCTVDISFTSTRTRESTPDSMPHGAWLTRFEQASIMDYTLSRHCKQLFINITPGCADLVP
jgi:hypothetical protein